MLSVTTAVTACMRYCILRTPQRVPSIQKGIAVLILMLMPTPILIALGSRECDGRPSFRLRGCEEDPGDGQHRLHPGRWLGDEQREARLLRPR